VPVTILRARLAAARLFFGKIAGGRDLARSHFLFPVKEKRAVAQEKLRAPVLPPVCPWFTSTKSRSVTAGARGNADHRL
jgi:hypothetical protein